MTLNHLYESFNLSTLDSVALLFFITVWAVYNFLVDHSRFRVNTITHIMDRQRLVWLTEATGRELRTIDTGILNILVTGISFYGSSTIIVLGGLIAAIGYSEQLAVSFSHIPMASSLSADGFVLRIGLLISIFIYAFFKFAWAFRLANYCAIIIGGMSDNRYDEDRHARQKRATVAAELSAISGRHFTRGIRAYFFALAALTWFVGPIIFMLTTLAVLFVLTRRIFVSNSVKMVRDL